MALKQPKGSVIGILKDGKTVQEKFDEIGASIVPGNNTMITPQMFGAKADYVGPVFNTAGDTIIGGDTGTDDTAAIQAAIDFAVSKNFQEVFIPAGNYLVKDSLYLAGSTHKDGAQYGVRLRGANWNRSQFIFDAPAEETPCIINRGNPGTHTPKGIDSIALTCRRSNRFKGIGYLVESTCFSHNYNMLIQEFKIGIRLSNIRAAGQFTEFNYFRDGRLKDNGINVQFYRDGGDASFHGNGFSGIQNQIRKNGTGYTAGIGVEVRGVSGVCYLYNQMWEMQFFGGIDCKSFNLVNCNTDYLWGALTAEGATTMVADELSNFEFNGPYTSISPIYYVVPTETDVTVGRFSFANRASREKEGFSNPKMPTDAVPQILQYDFANRMSNGCYPGFFKIHKNEVESLAFATYNQSGNAFWFGDIAYKKGINDFNPTFYFDHSGNRLTSFANDYTIKINGDGNAVTLSDGDFSPTGNDRLGLGTATKRWSSINLTGSYLNNTGYIPRADNTLILGQSGNTWKEGYFKSLTIDSTGIIPTTNNTSQLGNASNKFGSVWTGRVRYTSDIADFVGTGTPEGQITAGVGSTFRRSDGGAGTSFYVKESGTGNTGWVAK